MAGKDRVPHPATGMTTFLISMLFSLECAHCPVLFGGGEPRQRASRPDIDLPDDAVPACAMAPGINNGR
ncbi:hypothetical protein [Solidesulfovibrio sp.]